MKFLGYFVCSWTILMDGGQNVQHLARLILTQPFQGNGSFCLVRCLHLSEDHQAVSSILHRKDGLSHSFQPNNSIQDSKLIYIEHQIFKINNQSAFSVAETFQIVRKQHSTRKERERKKSSNCFMFL